MKINCFLLVSKYIDENFYGKAIKKSYCSAMITSVPVMLLPYKIILLKMDCKQLQIVVILCWGEGIMDDIS